MKGHVYRRGSSWYYKFPSPELNDKGKHDSITKGGFTTEAEAWKACRDAMAEVERGRHVKKSTRTVEVFFDEWLPTIKMLIDVTTWDNWNAVTQAYVKPKLGAGQLQQLTAPMLLNFYSYLLENGRIKADTNTLMYRHWAERTALGENPTPRDLVEACGVSIHAARKAIRRYKDGRIPKARPSGLEPKTVRNIHVMIHRALADAKRWKYIHDNPAETAKPPRVARKRRPVWNPNQATAFMRHIRHHRFYVLYRLELTTGLRRGEVCGIRWPSLDLDNATLSVHESRVVVDGQGRDGQVKTEDSARLIALDPETVHALRAWKALQDLEREFFHEKHRDTDRVFTWQDGRPVHPGTVSDSFKRMAARAALPEIRFYDLRHSYVTGALKAGINPKVVSERIGHADVAFTLKAYAHVLPGMDADAAVIAATYLLGDPTPDDS